MQITSLPVASDLIPTDGGMWPRRPKRPHPVKTPFSAYLRGRLVGASIGLPGEGDLYSSDDVPLPLRVAFALGATSKKRGLILSAAQVERKVTDLLDLAQLVEQVERDDDPGLDGSPPPPVPVVDEKTERMRSTKWIGDPLPTGT